MDKELKAKWLDALRSGQYQQAVGVLKGHEDGGASYCCLGVLCLAAGATWENSPRLDERPLDDADEELLGEYGLRVTGLKNSQQTKLSEMNDGGATFPEIADYIEANL